ncbi:hypothetical protein Tcan_13318 [Toxocara canis]|uniref:F-box domain-containing protein n=2 Tax=Toxocara canis TaxID=6265 RepID=A0A0B2VUG8_TOXCA|nr:hypothetical protein Tcan_13318 [Toxocara canis]VDM42462.1 unnamed protein product [Toxocara canis]
MRNQTGNVGQLRSSRRRGNSRKLLLKKRKRRQKDEDVENVDLSSVPSTSSLQSLSPPIVSFPVSPSISEDEPMDEHFPFDQLPPHIQKKILSYLPSKCRVRLERVSATWKKLLDCSWQNMTSADIPSTVTDSFHIRPIDDHHVCGFLQKCGRYLRNIDFFIPHINIGRHVLFSICQRCVNLRELRLITDVNGGAMTNLLKEYSHQLAQLQSLTISYQAQDELNNGMRAVARSMTELRTFRLDCYTMPANVSALFPNSPHMKVYSLLLKQPSGVGGASSPSQGVIDAGGMPFDCKYVRAEFVHDFLAYLADVYLELEQLDISFDTNYRVDEERVYHYLCTIGSSRPLSRLNLRIAALLDDSDEWFGVRALESLAHFPSLTHLSLWTCALPRDVGPLFANSNLSNNLTSLRLSIVRELSHRVLCSIFAVLPSLTSFTLIYSIDDRFACPDSIDAHTFTQLFRCCGRLTHLELHDCLSVNVMHLAASAHSYFHNSLSNTRGIEPLRIVLKSRQRKRKREPLYRLVGCCTEMVTSRGSTIITVHSICRNPDVKAV